MNEPPITDRMEFFRIMDSKFSDQDKEKIKKLESLDAWSRHFGYGLFVRNRFIYGGNVEGFDAQKAFAPYEIIIHPDTLSSLILKQYQYYLLHGVLPSIISPQLKPLLKKMTKILEF